MENRSMLTAFMSVLETFAMDCQDDCEVVVSGMHQDGEDIIIVLEANDGTLQAYRMSPLNRG